MKAFCSLLFVVLALAFVSEASAQKVKTVVNPPGLFNRSKVKAVGGGNVAAAAAINGRGFAASAGVGRGAVASANFGNFRAAASFGGFNAVASVGRPVVFANSAKVFGVSNQGFVKFNSFGTRTVQDGFGNVFEVDAFGNSRFVGQRFNGAVLNHGFNTFAAPQAVGFSVFSHGCH